jgi:uncharacterized surface protein with fasciclin (FAS1) repeats
MSRLLKISLCLLSLLLVLTNCRKDKWKADYERPDWLVPPMYQQLQAGQGGYTFKLFLACINKTAYKNVLDRAGYYTLFAPHDSAFQVYLDANFGGSIDNLDSTTARKIVSTSMVYNAYKIEHLVDYQLTGYGYYKNKGYKKRTVYYKGAYVDSSFDEAMYPTKAYNNSNSLMYDANRQSIDKTYTQGFDINDNACKYMPFFFKSYFDAVTPAALTSADYNYFFPNSVFNGLNVADARIVVADIQAENGYIHIVDKVLVPRPSLDEYLAKNKNYSVFKNLLDTLAVLYASSEKSTRVAKINGEYKTVFYKRYSSSRYSAANTYEAYYPDLFIQPENENYKKADINDAQYQGYTIFAPTNDAMNDFLNNKLLTYYKTIRQVPIYVLVDVLNAHMFDRTVWPSTFANAGNIFSEAPFFNKTSDVVDRQFLSNGVLYGTNKVQAAKKFYSVFGELYLNPDYYQEYRLIVQKASASGLDALMTDPSGARKYVLFMVHNSTIKKWAFNYNSYLNSWGAGRGGGTGFFSLLDFSRWAKLHLIPLEKVSDATMMSDDGTGYNVVMMKSLDENYVAARWYDIPVDPKNPLGSTTRSLGFYSSGNVDSVDITGAVAVPPQLVPTAYPATMARWLFVPSKTISATNGPNIFGDTLNYSTLIYSQVPVGRTIQSMFYDNIYDNLKRGVDETSATWKYQHYQSFYNYGDASTVNARYWYCNTFYPTLNLQYRDTMYFAYMRNMSNGTTDYGYFDKTTGNLSGVPGSVCYTVLVPNGDAMLQAARDGFLPEDTSVYNALTKPNGRWDPAPTTPAWSTNPLLKTGKYKTAFTYSQFLRIRMFFRMHILLQGFSADGNGVSGNVQTALTYQDVYNYLSYIGDNVNAIKYNISGNVQVTVTPSGVTTKGATITDAQGMGSSAAVIYNNGNILGNNVVIHQISGYLKYKTN